MFLKRLALKIIAMDFGSYLDPLTKHRLINAPPLSDHIKNLTPDKFAKESFAKKVSRYPKNKRTRHDGDSYIIYEAGQRDPLDPFSKQSFDRLVEETEGPTENSFSVNRELLEPVENPPEPSGDNASYPQAALWWQKGLS